MDDMSKALAEHIFSLSREKLTDDTLHEAKKRIIDSLACAVGAWYAQPVQIARRVARHYRGAATEASIFVSGEKTAADMAAFVNTAMIRYLDYNDSYIGPADGGHPSDIIPAVLAVAEDRKSDGITTLLGVVAAYEGFCPFIHAMPLREQGWDHGLFSVLGAAVGVGKVLGLSVEQLAEAASLAVSPNVPTRQARAGELSFWKGTATAASSRAGLFAALLAQEGMTGPVRPFLGHHGVVGNVAVDPGPIVYGGNGRPYGVELASIKSAPVEYHLQAPVQGALALRQKFDVDALRSLEVDTYWYAYSETGSEPEKWRPTSRETADHSMPYVLAAGLVDGKVTVETFLPGRIVDTALHDVMDKITIRHDKGLTDQYPDTMQSHFKATLKNGAVVEEHVQYPKGHRRNPMKAEDVDRKFHELCGPVLGAERSGRLLDILWRFEELPDLSPVFKEITVPEKALRH